MLEFISSILLNIAIASGVIIGVIVMLFLVVSMGLYLYHKFLDKTNYNIRAR